MLIELQHPFNLLQHNINIVNYLQLCHPGVSSFRHQLLLLRTPPLSQGPLFSNCFNCGCKNTLSTVRITHVC